MDYNFEVEQEEKGKRIDLFLVSKLGSGYSRTFIQQLILKKEVLLNNLPVSSHHKVNSGDFVSARIIEDKETQIAPEDIALKIVYEDDDILVVDKPSGLVVHPGAGNLTGTLVNALLNHTKNLSCINPQRPGIVHRLDKETSGVMVVAKNNMSHLKLVKQFASHSIKRKYVAVVSGAVEFDEGVIDLPIGRHKRDFRRQAVSFYKSKEAVTRYKVLKRLKNTTMLELIPETGRTHQLRVHLAHLGHPILGDTKYARTKDFTRLALHAAELGFMHPGNGKFVSFSSCVPEEFFIRE